MNFGGRKSALRRCGMTIVAATGLLVGLPLSAMSVTEFGARGDGSFDNAAALQRALTHAAANPGTILSFPQGVYVVRTPQAPDGFPRGRFFELQNVQDLTIDGNGSELIFTELYGGFVFEQCGNITIRDLTMDYDPPIFSQGDILHLQQDPPAITVRTDPGYPTPDDKIFEPRFSTWMTAHHRNKDLAYAIAFRCDKLEKLKPRTFRIFHDNRGLGRALQGEKDLRYVRVARHGGWLMRFNFCRNVRVEHTRVHASSGFLGLFCMCENITIRGNAVVPRPGSGRIIATCADGYHLIGCHGWIVIEDNTFDRLEDDNVVIVLRGNRILRVSEDRRQVVLKKQSVTWYRRNDTARVVDFRTGSKTDYTVVDVDIKGRFPKVSDITLTLDRPLQEGIILHEQAETSEVPPHLVFDADLTGEATVRNNRFLNNRARGVLVSSMHVTVERNRFSRSAFPPILVKSFARSSRPVYTYPTDDLVVRDNRLEYGMNFGGRTGNKGAITVTLTDDHRRHAVHDVQVFRNISILGNTLLRTGTAGIHVANARDVKIRGNRILYPHQLSGGDERYGVLLEAVQDVVLDANTVTGEDLTAPVSPLEP